MARLVKCGLIQATHACDTGEKLEIIREANVNKHLALIEQAGKIRDELQRSTTTLAALYGPYPATRHAASASSPRSVAPGVIPMPLRVRRV